MPTTAHLGRNARIANIDQQLGAFVSAARIAIKKNLPSYNVISETTLAGLLNLIHGWNLVNANSKKQNFPGVDLIDPNARVAVQVTSTNKPDKVDHTLDQFAGNHYGTQFDRLIILVITDDNPTPAMKGRALSPWFSGETDIWNIPKVSDQIQNLQDPALVGRICDYLNLEVGKFTDYANRQHLYLPLRSALGEGFVGRQEELARISEKLCKHVNPVVLSGLGGMGKTELAVRFGQQYEGGSVYFVRFNTSFTATVTAMFRGVSPQPQNLPPENEQYQTVMTLLRGCGEEDILIIDNVDADSGTLQDLMKDKTYKALKEMKLQLLLTTRFDDDRAVGIRAMPNRTLYEIFWKHGVSLEEPKMDALINAVNGHTLTIDLMARTLNGKGWRKVTADMLLDAIRENTLPGENYRKIVSDYSQSEGQAQIYQHLKVVFDAAGVSPDGKNVLRCATLLPEGGMNGEYFYEALNEAEQNEFEALIDHGWLNAEDGLLTIHPVIRLVCREELKPDEETCGDFLEALWWQLSRNEYDRIKFAQMAEMFAAAMEIEGQDESKAEWLNCSGRLWNDLMESRKAMTLYEKYLPQLAQRIPTSPALATACNNVGITCDDLGDYQTALVYKLTALTITEKVLPTEHPSLAISYNNVGISYSALGNYQKALEYHLKALTIRKKVLPPDHPDLAQSYNNVGSTYGHLGNRRKALEYQLKALTIKEKVLPNEHPNLAISYNNVGNTYGDLGDHEKALEYLLKALTICERVLPPDHPSLATAYNNVGYTYFQLKQYATSIEYLEKALAIREKSLPAGHPDTEGTRRGIEVVRTWM